MDICCSCVNDKVALLVIIPKICLKAPCEDYARTTLVKLESNFSNCPIVKAKSHLEEGKTFALSCVMVEDNIIWCVIIYNIDIYTNDELNIFNMMLKIWCKLIPVDHLYNTNQTNGTVTKFVIHHTSTHSLCNSFIIGNFWFFNLIFVCVDPLQIMHIAVGILNGLNTCVKVIETNI